jgi:hypothetical protein
MKLGIQAKFSPDERTWYNKYQNFFKLDNVSFALACRVAKSTSLFQVLYCDVLIKLD